MYRTICIVFAAAACSGKAPTTSGPRPSAEISSERGGRAFDQWANDPGARAATPPAAPPRLKDLFGWDLRGSSGVYGEAYLAKSTALARDWLAGSESVDEIVALLRAGGDGVPAYGAVLDEAALKSIALFITGVRDGSLARPDWIFELSPGKHAYTLRPGADPERGRALFEQRCADCHGADGTELVFDDGAYTLGSHTRQKAYEDWFKILNGQPGTDMGRQVVGDGRAMAQQIHDLLAALCDRVRFPRGATTAADVPDGDPRCGAYLR
jgi:mono/diheme cytochrome c family protein